MHRLSTVILAAGQGTRLKSKLNKVLHPVCGRPMVDWSVAAARAIGSDQIVLVVGNDADAVREHVGQGVTFVLQEQRLGTAHAVIQAQKAVEDFGANSVLVFYGDMPALRAETLAALVARQRESDAVFALLSVIAEDPMGFGRVVRDAKGKVQAIVEEAAASPEVLAIRELNCGVYCFDADWLWENIQRIEPTPPKNEYYLPDVVDLAASAGESIKVVCIDDVEEIQGVNNRVHLAECTRILHKRINQEHMLNGVSHHRSHLDLYRCRRGHWPRHGDLSQHASARPALSSARIALSALIPLSRVLLSATAVPCFLPCWKELAWMTVRTLVPLATCAREHTWARVCTWAILAR